MEQRKCKGCGAPIAYVKSESGSTIPIDLRTPVYQITTDMAGAEVARPVQSGFFISHFHTCPKANDFSGSNRKKGTP